MLNGPLKTGMRQAIPREGIRAIFRLEVGHPVQMQTLMVQAMPVTVVRSGMRRTVSWMRKAMRCGAKDFCQFDIELMKDRRGNEWRADESCPSGLTLPGYFWQMK